MRLLFPFFLALAVCAGLGGSAVGQEAPATPPVANQAPPVDPAESEIAFRFSDEFFRTLLRRRVERTTSVNQCVLGASVSGSAHTQTTVDLLFQPNSKAAQFYILLNGQTMLETVGAKGPARVYTTTTTHFRAWKLVRFDRDRFITLPAGIQATTWSATRGVGSTARTRIVHRLVQRVASNRAAESRGYTNSLANQQTRRQVLDNFNEAVDSAIDEANLRLSVRQTLLSRFGNLENLAYRLLTTNRNLEILVNIASTQAPTRPPVVDPWNPAPLEIWVRTQINDETLPPILQEWAPRYRYFIERGFERLAEAATPEEVDFTLQFTPQLDWVVMRFGDELLERLERRVQERRTREQGSARE